MVSSLEHLKSFRPVAYFSMEMAIDTAIPTYSGGLGILAGDTVRTAADLGIPFIAITQLSRSGYFRQIIGPSGEQQEQPVQWSPSERLQSLPETVTVHIEGRPVLVRAWMYECTSFRGHIVPVLFLDTAVDGNQPEDRTITNVLYGGDTTERLKQEIILGVGGVRILAALGLAPRKFHINEGHGALVALELLAQAPGQTIDDKLAGLKNRIVFTTHTPVAAGHDRFPYAMFESLIRDGLAMQAAKRLCGDGELNMTLLALNSASYVNGVALRHQKLSTQMFPGHRIASITNGVHSHTWTAPSLRDVLNEYIPGWASEPTLLARVDVVPAPRIWQAHRDAKRVLVQHIADTVGTSLDENVLTIGFARRFTAYKRPLLLFSDIERLKRIGKRYRFQLVFAGKAHPHDEEGKRLIARVIELSRTLGDGVRHVYLPDYDIATAQKMVAGVDVWLNTPNPPLEASGTSGMKAAHNGVINFSVLDGWWIEGHHENKTGWAIGPGPDENLDPEARLTREMEDLYGKLEYVILPKYYEDPDGWVRMMRNSIDDLASYFNTHRMLRHYVTEAYFGTDY